MHVQHFCMWWWEVDTALYNLLIEEFSPRTNRFRFITVLSVPLTHSHLIISTDPQELKNITLCVFLELNSVQGIGCDTGRSSAEIITDYILGTEVFCFF